MGEYHPCHCFVLEGPTIWPVSSFMAHEGVVAPFSLQNGRSLEIILREPIRDLLDGRAVFVESAEIHVAAFYGVAV